MYYLNVKSMKKGKDYVVSTVSAKSPLYENGSAYPWGDKDTKIPVRVIDETKFFYTCTVLPHDRGPLSFGVSRPYNVSIMKSDISKGNFKIYKEVEE